MSDAERQYEMVDPRGFVNPKHVDVDLVSFLPANARGQSIGFQEIGYENIVAISSTDEHTYESPPPACTIDGSKKRAKVNELYEGFSSDDCLTNAKIFEAIRNLDYPLVQKKRQCQLSCFAVFSLILLTVISVSTSGYVFYKVEIQKSSRCSCGAYSQEIRSPKKIADHANIHLLTQQVDQIKKNLNSLEKKLNQTKMFTTDKKLNNTILELSKINQSLNSGNYWAPNLEEMRTVLDSKTSEVANNLNMTRIQLNQHIESINNGAYWTKKLNETKDAIDLEMLKLRSQLEAKGSFRECTLKNKTRKGDSTDSSRVEVFLRNQSADQKIVGVTCASKTLGIPQDSYLQATEPSVGKITYKCVCVQQNGPSNLKIECIMYYWQCTNA